MLLVVHSIVSYFIFHSYIYPAQRQINLTILSYNIHQKNFAVHDNAELHRNPQLKQENSLIYIKSDYSTCLVLHCNTRIQDQMRIIVLSLSYFELADKLCKMWILDLRTYRCFLFCHESLKFRLLCGTDIFQETSERRLAW